MADQKVSDLPSLNGADVDAADLLYIVDSSAGAAGSKKITIGQYQLAPVSGGTANTVVYLNGSKVESSSSALTFDGTNFATTGTSSAAKLIPTGGTATGNGMYLPAANTLAWSNNGAETMRLDSSGNLGLGVTPSAWSSAYRALDVFTGGTAFFSGSAFGGVQTNSFVNASSQEIYKTTAAASKYLQVLGEHRFYTAPSGTAGNAITFTQAMTLDASGNLGIGTSSPAYKLVVSNGGASGIEFGPAFSGTANLIQSYNRSGAAYVNTVYDAAEHRFNISGTERMRLDSSGNLGLGVTPSASWSSGFKALQIAGQGAGISVSTSQSQIWTSSNGVYNGSNWLYQNSASAGQYQIDGNAHKWFTAPSGTAGNAISFTQAMTLDADGELGIGVTSPSAGLDVRKQETSSYNTARFSNGTDVQFLDVMCGRALTNGTAAGVASSLVMTLRSSGSSAGHLAFATGNDERARVTQGGDLLVGTTSLAGAGGISFQSQSGTGFAVINNNNAGATGYVFESFRRSSVEIGSITQNGTTAVLFNTTSDRRLKDNITPAPSASDVIDAIEIVSHDWKSAPDEHVTYGVIAQDLALVAPQAVLQGDDGDEIEKTWGVDYSKLVPMLIKEIQSLRARVAALEAK